MVFVPWAKYGICKFWMVSVDRCYDGPNCKWSHPALAERKRLWDEELAKQDEDKKRGIPRPQPPPKKVRAPDQHDIGPYGPDKVPPPPPSAPRIIIEQGLKDGTSSGPKRVPPTPPPSSSQRGKDASELYVSSSPHGSRRAPPPADHPVTQDTVQSEHQFPKRSKGGFVTLFQEDEVNQDPAAAGASFTTVEASSRAEIPMIRRERRSPENTKQAIFEEVSMLDAPPSPKIVKGENRFQPIGNANCEPLGKSNRLRDENLDTEMTAGTWKGSNDQQERSHNVRKRAASILPSDVPGEEAKPVWKRVDATANTGMATSREPPFKGEFLERWRKQQPAQQKKKEDCNKVEYAVFAPDDAPGGDAITVWKRDDAPADTNTLVETSPPRQGGYWERLRERQAALKKNENDQEMADTDPEIMKPDTKMSRDEITKQIEHQTSLVSASQFSAHALELRLPKMGATKRLSNGEAKHVGPHPSTIRVSAPYMTQSALEKKLQPPTAHAQFEVQERSIAEAREGSMRLQGCTWLDNVRRALQLPIRTYTTACVYYHKFRLAHPGSLTGMEYGNAWADACAASLLTSCKVEDTLKKSRDILAAAYNLKASTHDQLGSDDVMFEAPSRAVIGLERMVLEAGGFDFRSRYPHKLLVKIAKTMPEGVDGERERVSKMAWSILTDLHRTFAPLKQTSATLVIASIELAAHLVAASMSNNVSAVRDELQQYNFQTWSTSREEVMETLLDALDLYTQHTSNTILGPRHSLEDFIRIRLAFNKECSESNLPRYTIAPPSDRPANGSTLRVANGHPTPVSPPQPGTLAQGQQQAVTGLQATPEGGATLRFMLNPQLASDEKTEVQKYFVEEWEEYEEEIEVPKQPRDKSHEPERPRERERERPVSDRAPKERSQDGGRTERSDRESSKPKDQREREKERVRDRGRDIERERPRARDRERQPDRDRRSGDRRYEERDRRYDDRRDRRYDDRRDDRRFSDDRRRRDDRR